MPMAFTSRWKTRPKAIPSRPALPAIVLFGSLAGFSLACAGSKPPVEPSALPPRPARAIDVQLVFDEAADLAWSWWEADQRWFDASVRVCVLDRR